MAKPLFIQWATIFLSMGRLAFTFLPKAAEAGNFRLRAREHFEWLSVRYGAVNET